MNELSKIANEAKSDSLRDRILEKGARLEALKDFIPANAFQRDQSRLNQRNRMVYEKLMGKKAEDEETVQNFLGDVTISQPQKEKRGIPGWAAALIAAGAAGAGLAGAQMLPDAGADPDPPPAVVEDEGQIGYRLELE